MPWLELSPTWAPSWLPEAWASIDWPVSVGTPSIDYDIPEYWRALNINDVKLARSKIGTSLPPAS